MTELYSRRDVERQLEYPAALDAVETTYVETARGRVVNPPKLPMHLGDDGDWPHLNAFSVDMPAYVDWQDVAGVKWAVATWDADTDVPISSLILLYDLFEPGFTAVMEGMYVTGVRTAIQSVVGLKHLLHGVPESVGVFGAGFQAQFQLRVMDRLLDVSEFRVYDIDGARARDLADRIGPHLDATVEVVKSAAEATTGDAVVTVTDSKTPVFDESDLGDDAFVVALGTYQELPARTIRGADHVVVDHIEQCLQRGALAGLAARDEFEESDIDATIGGVLAETHDRPIDPDDSVVFVPIGLGSLDISIAQQVLEQTADRTSVSAFEFV